MNDCRIMTYNIRQKNDHDKEHSWERRKSSLGYILKKTNAEIVCLQEAYFDQIKDICQMVSGYDWLGVGREDGEALGEFSPIFYLKKLYKVEEWDCFWLSEKPSVPGSIGWDAACTRLVTWAKLSHIPSGKEIFVINTHLDHIGQEAVEKGTLLLKEKTKDYRANIPSVICGDFNQTSEHSFYKIMTQGSDVMKDSFYCSEDGHKGPLYTFHDFRNYTAEEAKEMKAIDYVFVSPSILVQRHEIVEENPNGIMPSDHMPLVVDLKY